MYERDDLLDLWTQGELRSLRRFVWGGEKGPDLRGIVVSDDGNRRTCNTLVVRDIAAVAVAVVKYSVP